jgi:Transcriptional regulatory protein, C terminal
MHFFSFKKISLLFGLLLVGWLLVTVATSHQKETSPSAEKINLALRRTAHLLLQATGDSTSQIPPIRQVNAHTWWVPLEHAFSYDQLPSLLDASFRLHGIAANYDVAILRCSDDAVLLGYNFFDYAKNDNAACVGRAISPDCRNLRVTFVAPSPTALEAHERWAWVGALAIVLLGLSHFGRSFLFQKKEKTPPETPSVAATQWLPIGQSRLDVANQVLQSSTTRHALTYRETKLLHLFARHPNQVLERAFILEQVWADEGILVGRSVDMFVSRLRKILRDDPSVALLAVHGVGYRMEVN